MSKTDISDLTAAFLARGGRVTYCPTKVVAKTQARLAHPFSKRGQAERERIQALNAA